MAFERKELNCVEIIAPFYGVWSDFGLSGVPGPRQIPGSSDFLTHDLHKIELHPNNSPSKRGIWTGLYTNQSIQTQFGSRPLYHKPKI